MRPSPQHQRPGPKISSLATREFVLPPTTTIKRSYPRRRKAAFTEYSRECIQYQTSPKGSASTIQTAVIEAGFAVITAPQSPSASWEASFYAWDRDREGEFTGG
ncbi:hypothetical protein E4U35_001458 [Claviceps purpurea]|nr:hypothetical protein E4U35_001458 [Claviceps purpurea]KAG6216586.1 hypothetical protein E4U50_005497 [Claviceps purpurea]